MRDHLERRPENREIHHEGVPPMPNYAPTEDTDNPHSTPLRDEQERDGDDHDRPPADRSDITP